MTAVAAAMSASFLGDRSTARNCGQSLAAVSNMRQKANDQTNRCAKTSSDSAGAKSGQYSGKNPHDKYAMNPYTYPLRVSVTK
jgi:hypothetical protein